jgi:multidrug efflux pump subunit AcrA (membrane-fusion protein)
VSAARVARIAVRPGAAVEADTVVMVLENSELELAALEAERQAAGAETALVQLDVRALAEERLQQASLASLRSDLRDAERHANAAERLAPEGLMSDLDRGGALEKANGLRERVTTEEQRRAVLETGRTRQLAALRAEALRLHEIARFRRQQLAALEIRAGIRGVVQDIPLQNGQWVAVGTVLAKVAEPDRLKAEVKVAEANAKDLRRGLAVRFESPTGPFAGHVERVDPAVIGGSVRLDVMLDGLLPVGARPDQAVTGMVDIEKLPDVLFVARPAGALEGATVGVFRLEPDHQHASRVTARLGRASAKEMEVLSGLAEGDEIVVSDTTAWDGSSRIRLKE